VKSRVLWLLIVALSVALWIGCSGDDDPVAPPAGPTVVPDSVSFKDHIQPIFSARCAVSGCHVSPNPRAGLILTKGVAYANIVNVPATAFNGIRVTPGDPENSILYLLVKSGQMPARGARLTTVQVQTIQKWIVNNALDN
jgi:hypothetical protein